jgi:hypothetical protein
MKSAIKKKVLRHMTKNNVRPRNLLLYFLTTLFLTGCTTRTVITPQIAETARLSNFQIKGIIEYDGNRDYLPRTISDESVSDTTFTFQYFYDVAYGRDKTPQAIHLFNPLILIGCPIGENTLVVKGKLVLLKGKEVLKEYSATCASEKMRSLFSEGETFSELRKKGLIAVRDNIEAQMCQDSDFLSNLKNQE